MPAQNDSPFHPVKTLKSLQAEQTYADNHHKDRLRSGKFLEEKPQFSGKKSQGKRSPYAKSFKYSITKRLKQPEIFSYFFYGD